MKFVSRVVLAAVFFLSDHSFAQQITTQTSPATDSLNTLLKTYFAGLKLYEVIGNKKGIVSSYNNIGLVYYDQGNYSEALKNHLAALKIKQELNDKPAIASSYNNIGIVYQDQKKYSEALRN